jgi:hypothetical protein
MGLNTSKQKNKKQSKDSESQLKLAAYLVGLSFMFYLLHFAIFRDFHHIMLYLIGDIAFVFIEVLMVTVIIHRALELRDKRARLEKLNMVIGAFFSEVGGKLLECLAEFDPGINSLNDDLSMGNISQEKQFLIVSKWLDEHKFVIHTDNADWEEIKRFLINKREFMLGLLENPNLLEHESFTDLLWAVFHLTDELSLREDFDALPHSDFQHLRGDMSRVYGELAHQWLNYMTHLKGSYPYLFSLAIRMNPFNKNASPIIQES